MKVEIHKGGVSTPDEFDVRVIPNGTGEWLGKPGHKGRIVVLVECRGMPYTHKQAATLFRLIFSCGPCSVSFHGF